MSINSIAGVEYGSASEPPAILFAKMMQGSLVAGPWWQSRSLLVVVGRIQVTRSARAYRSLCSTNKLFRLEFGAQVRNQFRCIFLQARRRRLGNHRAPTYVIFRAALWPPATVTVYDTTSMIYGTHLWVPRTHRHRYTPNLHRIFQPQSWPTKFRKYFPNPKATLRNVSS